MSIDGLSFGVVQRRMYKELEAEASRILNKHGWTHLRSVIASNPGPYSQKPSIGETRDALVFVLGLADITGLDADFLTAFTVLSVSDLSELRETARQIAFHLLRSQVSRKNTFFIDIDMFVTSHLGLVSDIIAARREEILRLTPSCALPEFLQTYYGFMSLTRAVDRSMNKSELRKKAEDVVAKISQIMDTDLHLKTTSIDPSEIGQMFRNCTKQTRVILLDLLRFVGLLHDDSLSDVTTRISKNGDARVLPLLHAVLEQGPKQSIETLLIRCIARIGHPSTLEMLKSIVVGKKRGAPSALKALTHFPGIAATETLFAIGAMGLRTSDVIEAMQRRPTTERTKVIEEGLYGADFDRGGFAGVCLLKFKTLLLVPLDHTERLLEVLLQTSDPFPLLKLLLSNAEIRHLPEFKVTLAELIRESSDPSRPLDSKTSVERTLATIKRFRSLVSDSLISDAFAEALVHERSIPLLQEIARVECLATSNKIHEALVRLIEASEDIGTIESVVRRSLHLQNCSEVMAAIKKAIHE